jgi:hypothetical protein
LSWVIGFQDGFQDDDLGPLESGRAALGLKDNPHQLKLLSNNVGTAFTREIFPQLLGRQLKE